MIKIYKFFIIFLVCNISNILFSWDTEAAKYFPLNIGNSWTYYHTDYQFGCEPVNSYRYKILITTDSVINGHRYFRFSNGSLYRIDSSSMNVYRRNFNTDCLYDSLLAKVNDQFNSCSGSYYISDTSNIIFGGQPRRTRTSTVLDGDIRKLMYGIGLYSQGICLYFSGGATDGLNGCVINGIVYGDTTFTPPDTSLIKYLPLKLGNSWTYSYYWYPYGGSGRFKQTVTSSNIINGHLYFNLDRPIRIDSANGNLLQYSSNGCSWLSNEILVDSLASKIYDTCSANCAVINIYRTVCSDTSNQTLFGSSHKTKAFTTGNFESVENRRYAKDIGLITRSIQSLNSYYTNLIGCVIDGIVYGDTSLLETHSISGTVRYNDNNEIVTEGYVKALRHSYLGNTDVLDSTAIRPNGSYTLTRIPPNDTFDLMAFQDDEVDELDFVPTFYISTIYWQEAEHLYLNNDTSGINIGVFRIGNDGFSSGIISGGVYGYSRTDSWIPIESARIYALSLNTFRNYDITTSAGIYEIDSLPPGQYRVICDRLGYPSHFVDVYLADTNRTNINFYYKFLAGIYKEEKIPLKYSLSQNYPNPFNPVTHIKFSIIEKEHVCLKIYDVLGKEIAALVDELLTPGNYSAEWDGANYPSGVYFYKIETPGFSQAKKLVLLK